MSLDALPFVVLIVLAEFALGSLIAVLIVDARGLAPEGFVRLSSAIVVICGALALLAAVYADDAVLEDYALEDGLFGPIRGVSIAFLLLSLAYATLVHSGERERSLWAGTAAAIIGAAGLGLVAYQVSPPTWSPAGTSLSMLAGALVLGFAGEAMILGHWYLVTPKLSGQPLQELTFLLMLAVAAQGILLIVNAAIPANEVPETSAVLSGSLATNPAFWLRGLVGLLFPLVLAFMAWRSALEDSMMSATGLLYIAVGAVFAGEIFGRGLLFVTGSPV
jgi:hypothetical protein